MPQGGGQDADEYAYIRISGGTVRIVTGGDGADPNGKLTVAGGALYVSGPENGANGALDYGTDAVITGGTVCAAGTSDMAVNFGKNSQQTSLLCWFGKTHSAGTEIVLKDKSGNTVLSFAPSESFSSAVLSCPELKNGTYTVTAGDETVNAEITGVSAEAGTHTVTENGGRKGTEGGMPEQKNGTEDGKQ